MKMLLALLLTAATSALAIPSQITAEYQLTNRGITIGRVTENFVRKGDTYAISSVSRSEGILKVVYDEQITLQSAGNVVAGGLQPLQFEERRTRESKRDVNATFDWSRNVMQSRFKGETSWHALPPQTQDRLSMMYQFMLLQPRSGDLVMSMSNGRKVESYVYRVVEEVRLPTALGELDTLHLERVTTTPRESKVEVWLAKAHHNFPVRVIFDDPKGLRVEQTIVALQAR
jgi:Protein of unknown function (DUF3108)